MSELMIKLTHYQSNHESGRVGIISEAVRRLVHSYGAKLSEPISGPGSTEQYAQVYDVPAHLGEKLRQDLERLDDIEAAYFKPADELP